MNTYLKVINGNVEEYNSGAQRVKVYYTKGSRGPAARADWENQGEKSVQVQLSNGQILIINRGCQIVKII